MLEPWRKNFPICKPYASHDKADAVRFLRELEEGCNRTDADVDWTIGDVIRGLHCGGTNAAAPPIFGNVQQQAKQTRDRDKRRAKLASTLMRYILVEGIKEDLRAAGQNGEQMIVLFRASEVGAASELSTDQIKASSTEAEISAGVGACKDLRFVKTILAFMWAGLALDTELTIAPRSHSPLWSV